MEYALITGWTSGIWKEVSKHLLDKELCSIITWSKDSYKTWKNEIYLKNDQSHDFKISEKIKNITGKLKYVFLNAGIFVPDEADKESLKLMNAINYQNTIKLLHDLQENHLLDDAKIIVNASIQAAHPRELTKEYAETKKKLSDKALTYAKEKHIQLSVIWPSAVKNTPMVEKLMNYYISKGIYANKNDFLNKVKMTNMSDVLNIIDKMFFWDEKNYKKEFMLKFIPIK